MPVSAEAIDITGDNSANSVNGAKVYTDTPSVCAAKAPATPHGTK